jgi:dephospho-CoA kinase
MIIGITGTLGAGKGTVTNYLVEKKGFKQFAVSDTFLAGEAAKRGLEPNRIVRRDIANEFRAQGPTKLMEAVYALAVPSIEAGENVVIDPQHTVAEVEFIKSKGGIVFSVDADLKARYERIQERKSSKDNVTFEDFRDEQEREMFSDDPNKNNLGTAIKAATIHLTNNGTPEELFAQVDAALAKYTQQ